MTSCVGKLVLAGLMALASVSSAAQTVSPGDEARMVAYDEFRRLFAGNQFAEALPFAERVVQLTEGVDPNDNELPVAYNNLGVVQLRVGDLDAAEASFRRALELLEDRVGIVSRRLIAPLAGLGAVHAARGNHALAADSLQRALAISRRANGLFNIGQMALLESLIENYEAVGNKPGVERERHYAVQIVQQEYGFDDPRTIPATILLAEWYEGTERYALAHEQWQRIVDVASLESGGRNAATVLGLLGVARNHRLQFVLDPKSLDASRTPVNPHTGQPDPLKAGPVRALPVRLDRKGEVAAVKALEILDETPDPPKRLLARALIELGDWYVTAGKVDTAIPYYQRAWPLLVETVDPGEPNPLASPRPLLYRAPTASSRYQNRTDVEVVPQPIEFTLNVSPSGETSEIELTSGNAFQAAHIQYSLIRAKFSPRFENGMPVATVGYQFTGIWYGVVTNPKAEPVVDPLPANGQPPS